MLGIFFKFLDFGIYLREVTLPTLTDYPDFKIIKDKSGDKWRANMIIIGKQYDLSNVDTFKYLIEKGADIHADGDFALRWSARKGYFDVNYLFNYYYTLKDCDSDKHPEIYEYLKSKCKKLIFFYA